MNTQAPLRSLEPMPIVVVSPTVTANVADTARPKYFYLAQATLHMKTFIMLIGCLASLTSAHASMLGINIELSRDKEGKTVVSIHAGALTENNRDSVTVQAAAKVLHDLKFNKDAKFAVIHSKVIIPMEDLMPIFEAMIANDIGLGCIQIGTGPPSGMDIWNHK